MRAVPDMGDDCVSRKVNLRMASVLIVDANEASRTFTHSICRTLKFGAVWGAANVNEAFELLSTEKIDLLLCDWGASPLPYVDFITRMRRFGTLPNNAVPVIVVTSNGGQEAIREARDAGVDDFVMRPLAMRRLLNSFISVLCLPRTYVRSESYTGPCRRLRQVALSHPDRRLAWRGERLPPSAALLHMAQNQRYF